MLTALACFFLFFLRKAKVMLTHNAMAGLLLKFTLTSALQWRTDKAQSVSVFCKEYENDHFHY